MNQLPSLGIAIGKIGDDIEIGDDVTDFNDIAFELLVVYRYIVNGKKIRHVIEWTDINELKSIDRLMNIDSFRIT
jgi:hypothetical protein